MAVQMGQGGAEVLYRGTQEQLGCVLPHSPLSQWKGVPGQSHPLGVTVICGFVCLWLVGCFCFICCPDMRGKSHIWLGIRDWHLGGKEREAENGFQPKGPAAVLSPGVLGSATKSFPLVHLVKYLLGKH